MSKESESLFTETWTAILMSLTALVTAWSAYQSNLWTGAQSVDLSEALQNQTILTQNILSAQQTKTMDGILVLEIVKAKVEKEDQLSNFILPRLREELRKPIVEWLAMDPINNPNAPAHPLLMPSYLDDVVKKNHEQEQNINKLIKDNTLAAQESGKTSDSYVLLTVLFAAVLFFAGIASTFNSLRVKVVLLAIATILFTISLWKLSFLEVAFS